MLFATTGNPAGIALMLSAGLLTACATTPATRPSPPAAVLTGQYAYMADAAIFVDCATGGHYPVAEAGDNRALQAAYLSARPTPGAPVLIRVEGRILERPDSTGRASLQVDRFLSADAAATCPGVSTASLENTYWKLTTLAGKPVNVPDGQREPHLLLHPEQQRVSGSGGCNRIMGGYTLSGDRLDFGKLASTLMMCLSGGELERDFLATLERTARWQVQGQQLTLLAADGATLAVFEPRYLR